MKTIHILTDEQVTGDENERANLLASLERASAERDAAYAVLEQLRKIDCLGRALELEEQERRVESQSIARAMIGATIALTQVSAILKGYYND